MAGKLFVVSAPSGAGKTSLVNSVLGQLNPPYNIERLKTYTSRAPRPGEKNGKDYHFVSSEQFTQLIDQNFFLEWSTAYGAYYGSPRFALNLIQEGFSYIAILDRLGAQRVIEQFCDAVLIWVSVPNIETLVDRLRDRRTEKAEEIAYRMRQAEKEMAQEKQDKLYNYHILNEKFDQAVHMLKEVVLKQLEM